MPPRGSTTTSMPPSSSFVAAVADALLDRTGVTGASWTASMTSADAFVSAGVCFDWAVTFAGTSAFAPTGGFIADPSSPLVGSSDFGSAVAVIFSAATFEFDDAAASSSVSSASDEGFDC